MSAPPDDVVADDVISIGVNIAVINTMLNKESSRPFNPNMFHEGIKTLVDACFVLHMAPGLFNSNIGSGILCGGMPKGALALRKDHKEDIDGVKQRAKSR